MRKEIQISAKVDTTTKQLLEQHVRATGVKKGYLLEQALRHYLFVHPRVVVTPKSGAVVRRALRSGRPTKALRALMRDGD
jgi:cAMP phosphodiesterase